MRTANKIVMGLAGLLLIAATVLKFHEMLSICIPSWGVQAEIIFSKAQEAGQQMPRWEANVRGFWESYEFFLIQIPLEFALGVWLVCGLFRKAAWLAGTLCYLGFVGVTLAKALLGFESCGCFGQIHVDPWISLFAIDVPLFLLLAIFRPKGVKLLPPPWPNLFYLLLVAVPTIGLMVVAPSALVALRPDCITVDDKPDESAQLKLQMHKLKQELSAKEQEIDTLNEAITELKQTPRSTDKKAFIGVLEMIASEKPNQYEINIGGKQTLLINADNLEKIILSIDNAENQEIAINEAGQVEMTWTEPEPVENGTSQQTTDANDTPPAVEPWEWLEFVVEDDVRQQISEGLVVVLVHRHNCPICIDVVPAYSEYYANMLEQGDALFNIAFLAVPPYHDDEDTVPDDTPCILGKLTEEKQWGVMSPYVVALLDGQLVKQWEQGTAPEAESLYDEIFEAFEE